MEMVGFDYLGSLSIIINFVFNLLSFKNINYCRAAVNHCYYGTARSSMRYVWFKSCATWPLVLSSALTSRRFRIEISLTSPILKSRIIISFCSKYRLLSVPSGMYLLSRLQS